MLLLPKKAHPCIAGGLQIVIVGADGDEGWVHELAYLCYSTAVASWAFAQQQPYI